MRRVKCSPKSWKNAHGSTWSPAQPSLSLVGRWPEIERIACKNPSVQTVINRRAFSASPRSYRRNRRKSLNSSRVPRHRDTLNTSGTPFDLNVALTTRTLPTPWFPRYRRLSGPSWRGGQEVGRISDYNALLSDGEVQLRVPGVYPPCVRVSTQMHLESTPRDTTLDNSLREIQNTTDVSGG